MLRRIAQSRLLPLNHTRLASTSGRPNVAANAPSYEDEIARRMKYLQRQAGTGTNATPHSINAPPSSPARLTGQRGSPASDKAFLFVTVATLVASPAIVYFWWQHRAEHMQIKKEQLLTEAQQRYKRSSS